MSAFAQWLYQHRGYHLLILAVIYVVGVIGHDAFTAPFDWFRDLTSIRTLTVMMYVIVGVLFVGLNILFYRLWHQHAERRLALILWSLTICLALLFNFTIMPFKAELVHYIQYTIIGFLVVPWIKNFLSAIYLGSILGCLDEFYQYVGLGKLYFDYNDVILNLVGSALGVVFAFSVLPSKRDKFSRSNTWPVWFWVALHSLTTLLFLTGVIKFFKDQGFPYWYNGLQKEYPAMFWQVPSNIAGPWHLISPYEGIVLVLILPLLYWPLRNYAYEQSKSERK